MVKERWKLNKNPPFWEKYFDSIRGWNGRTHIFCCLGKSIVSTKIVSFWGSIDEGLVGDDLNAWDNSSTPRAGWDTMIDNCEERNEIRSWISLWDEGWLFYLGSRWSRSAKSFPSNGFLGCPLGRLALWRLICFNCRGSMSFHQPMKVQLILLLRLGMVADNL